MWKLILLMLILCVAANAQILSVQEVQNYNQNWQHCVIDSVGLNTDQTTIVLGPKTYNLTLNAFSGETVFKLSKNSLYWPHWWRIPSGGSITISGGKMDTLFVKAATTSILQVWYSKMN